MRRGDGGDFSIVVSGRHFHHIHAHDIQIAQAADNAQRGVRIEAAGHGRAGARRKRGAKKSEAVYQNDNLIKRTLWDEDGYILED